jgi:flagellar basal-body rod protein FlgC
MFRSIAEIAGSAMTAETVRLNTIASNLANAGTAASSEAEAYHARKPVFATVFDHSAFSSDPIAGAKVQVLDVVESTEPIRQVYEPDNPSANDQGMVFYTNVNTVAEMTDMMSASRAFETNIEVLNRVKSMQQSVLKMGES